jgi:hypothetical protein
MAILYMLHMEICLNKRPKDLRDPGGEKRLRLLKNYATWVPCGCGACGLEWNFANDIGLLNDSGNMDCEILNKGDKRGRVLADTKASWEGSH